MGDFRAIKALVWKELRMWMRGSILLIVIPAVTLYAAHLFPHNSGWREGLPVLAAFMLAGGVVALVTSARSSVQNKPLEFADVHLPVKPIVRWLASSTTQTLIVAGLGAWFGVCASMQSMDGHYVALLALRGLKAAVSCFWIVSFFNVVLSKWVGALLGLVLGAAFIIQAQQVIPGHGHGPQLLVALIVGSLLFDVILRKYSFRVRQVAALAVPMGLVVFWIVTDQALSAGPYAYYAPKPIESHDWSEYVVSPDDGRTEWDRRLIFGNYRSNLFVTRRFKNAVEPIGFVGEDRVVMIQQLPAVRQAQVIEWNTSANRAHRLASFDAGRFSFGTYYGDRPRGFVRPDGRYVVLSLSSEAGSGRDLWAIDLRTGAARVIIPNSPCFADESVRWIGDTALLYGARQPVRVDLHAMRGGVIEALVRGERL